MKGNIYAETPAEYFKQIEEPRKSEIKKLHQLIRKVAPKYKVRMWTSIVGYGKYHYKYATGREGDWFVIGLASQKNYISLYCAMCDGNEYIAERYKKLLPKASIGKSCVRFKKLEDVDLKVIEKMLKETVKLAKKIKDVTN